MFAAIVRLSAEGALVHGVVKDAADFTPLNAATVFLDGDLVCLTGADGEFSAQNVQSGVHSLRFQRLGYKSLEITISIEQTEAKNLFIFMDCEPIEFSGMTVFGSPDEYHGGIVIGREELERSGSLNVSEAIEDIVGVTVTGQNPGDYANVYLSGPSAGRVGIYIDGIRINDPSSGNFDVSSIPISSVEKIVIIKNPGAGSDPGGQLHIFLKKPNSEENKVRTSAGSFDFYSLQIHALPHVFLKERYLSLDFSCESYNGGYPAEGYPGGAVENNDSRKIGSAVKLFLGDGTPLEISLLSNWRKRGVPGQADGSVMTLSRLSELNLTAWASLTGSLGNISYVAMVSHGMNSRQYLCPQRQAIPGQSDSGYFFPENSKTGSNSTELSLSLSRKFESKLEIVFSGMFKRQDYFFEDLLRESMPRVYAKRYDHSISAKAVFTDFIGESRMRLELEAMPVFTSNESEEDFLMTYSSFLNVFSKPGAVFASGGIGFSHNAYFPNFSQTHTVESAYSAGNPYLEPEKSHTLNLDFDLKKGQNFLFSARAFYSILEDMIVWRRNFKGQYQPQNLGKADGLGCDFYARLDFNRQVFLTSGISLQSVKNRTDKDINCGNYLTYRPVYRFSAAFGFKSENFFSEVEFRQIARRYTREANTDPYGLSRTSLEPYRVTNIYVTRLIDLKKMVLSFSLHLENIFDERYYIVEQMPVEGRTIKTEVSVTW
ncbi:TonB-dependent receptor [candidate division WOR-3 bacterium]|nr:TonB-dependent receptor [candidate division WOR-3 bacterium]